jgi:hypothetical protein
VRRGRKAAGPANGGTAELPKVGFLAARLFCFLSLLEKTQLLRFPHPWSLRRTIKYASFLRVSGALHLGIFEQPEQ